MAHGRHIVPENVRSMSAGADDRRGSSTFILGQASKVPAVGSSVDGGEVIM